MAAQGFWEAGLEGTADRLNAAQQTTMPPIFDVGGVNWVIPGHDFHAMTTQALVQHELYYILIFVERSTAFVRIGCHVTSAGAGGTVARLGIYNSVFDADGQIKPDTLESDSGTVSVASTGEKEITIARTLGKGFFFLVISSDGTPTVAVVDAASRGSIPVMATHATINSAGLIIPSVTLGDGGAALADPATAPDLLNQDTFRAVQLRT